MQENNYSLMILQSGGEPVTEAANLRLCRQNRISDLFACIADQASNVEAYLKLEKLDIRVVFFDKVPDQSNCNKVCVEDDGAATIAAIAILEKNKKKVLALMGSDSLLIIRKCLAAFKKTLDGQIELIVCYAVNAEEAEEATMACLKQYIDTIFCMSDEVLTGSMKAIKKSVLKIPEDISIIAISNGFITRLYYPEISYVETSGYKLGKLAFSRMMQCLAGVELVKELTNGSILVEGRSMG